MPKGVPNNPNFTHHCEKCGYDWVSEFEIPSRCPKVGGCGSFAFDVPKGELNLHRRGKVTKNG